MTRSLVRRYGSRGFDRIPMGARAERLELLSTVRLRAELGLQALKVGTSPQRPIR